MTMFDRYYFYENKVCVHITNIEELMEAEDIIRQYIGLHTYNHDGFTGAYQTDNFKKYISTLPDTCLYFYNSLGGITYNIVNRSYLESQSFFKGQYTFINFNEFKTIINQ